MDNDDVRPGLIRLLDRCFEARLEQIVGHDRDTVWRMLTEPQALAQWLAPGSIKWTLSFLEHPPTVVK